MHHVVRRPHKRSEFLQSDEIFFFFLSFAFTNGNVFWSQGFYNWENLQLIQYISRFHNFTISDVKSKKKNNNTQTDWQDTTNCIKISDCVYYSVVEELQNQFNPPTIKWKIVISQKPKKPLNFALNCAKQPLHCRLHLLTTLYPAGILFLE